MIRLDREQRQFVVYIVVLLVSVGLYLRLSALLDNAYWRTVVKQYEIGCFSTYIPTDPDNNPFYSGPPSSEICANLQRMFCTYRPFREAIPALLLILCPGGLLGLLVLGRFRNKHKVLFIACLMLYLVVISLVLLFYPVAIYSALRVLYIDC
jgi:hypothetical protein